MTAPDGSIVLTYRCPGDQYHCTSTIVESDALPDVDRRAKIGSLSLTCACGARLCFENDGKLLDDHSCTTPVLLPSSKQHRLNQSEKLAVLQLARTVTIERASELLGIPSSTLRGWAKKEGTVELHTGNRKGAGRPHALSEQIEQRLDTEIRSMFHAGIQVPPLWVRRQARKLFELQPHPSPIPFHASRHWLADFLKRHGLAWRRTRPSLNAANNPAEYAQSMLKAGNQIQDLWKASQHIQQKFNIPPSLVISNDELNIPFNPRPQWSIAPADAKFARVSGSNEDLGSCTLLVTGTAGDVFLTPLVVLQGQGSRTIIQLPDSEEHPMMVAFSRSSNFMKNKIFTKIYMTHIIGSYLTKERARLKKQDQPALLIMDNAPGHFGATMEYASSLNLHTFL